MRYNSIYDRNREFAYKRSTEGIEIIAETLLAESYGYDSLEDVFNNLDRVLKRLPDDITDDEYDRFVNEIDKELDELRVELEPLQDLSHARHNMHVSDKCNPELFKDFVTSDDEPTELVDAVNDIIDKYDIGVLEHIELPYMPDVYDWEDTEDIADYFDLPLEEDSDDYIDQYDTVYVTLHSVWGDAKNDYSNYLRSFFGIVNDRFGTKFPS